MIGRLDASMCQSISNVVGSWFDRKPHRHARKVVWNSEKIYLPKALQVQDALFQKSKMQLVGRGKIMKRSKELQEPEVNSVIN